MEIPLLYRVQTTNLLKTTSFASSCCSTIVLDVGLNKWRRKRVVGVRASSEVSGGDRNRSSGMEVITFNNNKSYSSDSELPAVWDNHIAVVVRLTYGIGQFFFLFFNSFVFTNLSIYCYILILSIKIERVQFLVLCFLYSIWKELSTINIYH